MKRFLIVSIVSVLAWAAGPAWAVEGDCNNDGQVTEADLDTLKASLNQTTDQPGLANCDYNQDGGLGLDDLGAHLKNQTD